MVEIPWIYSQYKYIYEYCNGEASEHYINCGQNKQQIMRHNLIFLQFCEYSNEPNPICENSKKFFMQLTIF